MNILTSFNLISANSVLILTSIVLYVIYWIRKTYSYWTVRGVPQVEFTPFLGHYDLVFHRRSENEVVRDFYNQLDGHRFGGCYQLAQPTLIVRDPELIKLMLVKWFSTNRDRNPVLDAEVEPLSANIFQLTGEKWKQSRQKMAPIFSTSKLKALYSSMEMIADELDQYLQDLVENKGGEIDSKGLMDKYTLDVMGACAMGIKCGAIKDEETEFKKIFRQIFIFDFRRVFHNILELINPKLNSLLKVSATSPIVENFFLSFIKDNTEQASGKTDKRKDFFHVLRDARSNELNKVLKQAANRVDADENENSKEMVCTDTMMAANLAILIIAGFEGTATVLCFCLYELALQPDLQERLFSEIKSVKEANGGRLDFDELTELKYTDCVINEALRKYPTAGIIRRICTETFQIPDSSVVIEKGIRIFISVLGLQRDPKYFPNPEKFDPDRFSEENIKNIVPGTYLPFGDGPRICIGMRFGMLQMKRMLLTVISKYTIHPTEKTPKELKFHPIFFTLTPSEPVWLRFQKRENLNH